MKAQEFDQRRRALMRMMGKGTIAIVPSSGIKLRNRDVAYPFRQDSDFWYLTGFDEPDAVAVLIPGRKAGEYVLFCRDRDPAREAWDGYRAGPEGAVEDYGADDAFPIEAMDDILPGLIESSDSVFYSMGVSGGFDKRILGWLNELRAGGRAGARTPEEFVSLEHLLHDLRLYKSRAEVGQMRRAARVSMEAHRRAMRRAQAGVYEYELEAELLGHFRAHGNREAYGSIVGSGANSCILHYVENARRMEDGDLVLIDAGCEDGYYASDITRTFPVSGRFTAEQRKIYSLVLAAQKAAIDKCRAGNLFNEPHEETVRVITRGLIKLGLLKGTPARLIKEGAYQKFYMHRAGHWIGLDVHDVGDYKVGGEWRELEPGMVLTVEPGIYIPPGTRGVAKKWWGIGVRIEDDVLVTRGEPDVLTGALVKEPDEIEAFMQAA
ncbi:MAG: aminopeptidase P N-terminal domain-containing protein [Gammaproteobacteria bacterium]|nr:aminopeptidase P N-terminal domain-containing protein [Gammaproteobacteria bacterium]